MIPEDETYIRLGAFIGVLIFMGVWEHLRPRRRPTARKTMRWRRNLLLIFIGTALLRLAVPLLAVGTALYARRADCGVLNAYNVPYPIAFILGLLLLDLTMWIQHLLFHAVPVLWRLHAVHHADVDFDVTTGVRFHPMELIASMLVKMGVIMVMGIPPLGVLTFEILLNAAAMFNHGNVGLPVRVDGWLRLLIVTPDMHRVHHSVVVNETNSNFGFGLPWWDRLLGTYKAQPREGHEEMRIGLGHCPPGEQQTVWRLLVHPFTGKTGIQPINRRPEAR
jgi:sterol desaturase/sphingolipid hydroxylase (fatty acid hydroxylase superfamily)